MLAATVQYARDRVQFGTAIGRLQALQHRMADMYMQVEQARSMVYRAMPPACSPMRTSDAKP